MRATRHPFVGIGVCCASLLAVACGAASSSGSTPTPGVALAAKIPASALIHPGQLTICVDIPATPYSMYNANGQLVGTDTEISKGIAARLGLKPVFVNSVFDTIITALQTGKCDTIISTMDVTPDREQLITQIGYFSTQAGLIFKAGETHGIGNPLTDPHSLCGHKIVAEIGSTGLTYMQMQSTSCVKAGLGAIDVVAVQDDNAAYQLLLNGQVDAMASSPDTGGYYATQHPGTLEAGGFWSNVLEGIGVLKPNTVLRDGIVAALTAMKTDGALATICKNYGLDPATHIPPSFAYNS